MSTGQVNAYVDSLREGWEHNRAVLAYLENERTKLQAARQAYTETDSDSAESFGDPAGNDQ